MCRAAARHRRPCSRRSAESLRLDYAQFLELEVFTRFGTMVDERTRKTIEHGRRIRAVLDQRQFAPLSLGEQVALLIALNEGVLDELPLEKVADFRGALKSRLGDQSPDVLALADDAKALTEERHASLAEALKLLAQQIGAKA